MGKQNYTTEQIIMKLREVEVFMSQGKTIGESVRQIGVSEQTYYRWRNQYGGMGTSDAKKLKAVRERKCAIKKASSKFELG